MVQRHTPRRCKKGSLTERGPDRTSSELAVPYRSVQADTTTSLVLQNCQDVLETIINDLPINKELVLCGITGTLFVRVRAQCLPLE